MREIFFIIYEAIAFLSLFVDLFAVKKIIVQRAKKKKSLHCAKLYLYSNLKIVPLLSLL